MPEIERPDGTRIHYEIAGNGPFLLALAPEAVNSQVESWKHASFDPARELSSTFTVITMDQRYAGRSTGPNAPFSYATMAADQVAVLDAAGAQRALLLGEGIGATYALRLIHDVPERIAAAVLLRPPGLDGPGSQSPFYRMFEETMRVTRADGLMAVFAAARENPRFDQNPAAGPFGQRIHDDPDFVDDVVDKGRERYISRVVRFRDGIWPLDTPFFSVPPEWVAECPVPLLVQAGNDDMHPSAIAQMIATTAPHARFLHTGMDDASSMIAIRGFLQEQAG